MITDELREYVKDHTNWNAVLTTYPPQRTMTYYEGAMDIIANRIDAEHDKAIKRRVDALREERDEYLESIKLWEAKCSTMVELPRDADGEVIRIGDVLDNTHKDGFAAKAVIGISYHPGGKACVEVDENRLRWHDPSMLRHHRATVEDVLDEFANAVLGCDNTEESVQRVIAEYAAKLRLAESEGE